MAHTGFTKTTVAFFFISDRDTVEWRKTEKRYPDPYFLHFSLYYIFIEGTVEKQETVGEFSVE